MKSSRYLLEIIIYPSINFIIPPIVPSMQEFFLSSLSIGGGDLQPLLLGVTTLTAVHRMTVTTRRMTTMTA